MLVICPSCGEPISNWLMATGRIARKGVIIYHLLCYYTKIQDGFDKTAGWTVGVEIDRSKEN